ncbi:hypothetical protein INT45_013535 [Circinella minor]|uniref:Peregrin n=1 Tax=Circinella minor TaxID=1195481 RepID=A0A8H7S540_9FUNG|nr:hypothetical protein INT45_013535 [Circinella minor]
MPLKTRGRGRGTGRRGRPKKYPRSEDFQQDQLQQPQQEQQLTIKPPPPYNNSLLLNSSIATPTHHENNTNGHTAVRPREERSYKDYFPNLNLKQPLKIVRVSLADRQQDGINNNETATTTKTHIDNTLLSTATQTTDNKKKDEEKDNNKSNSSENNIHQEVPEIPRESSEESELSSVSLDESVPVVVENGSLNKQQKVTEQEDEDKIISSNSSLSLYESNENSNSSDVLTEDKVTITSGTISSSSLSSSSDHIMDVDINVNDDDKSDNEQVVDIDTTNSNESSSSSSEQQETIETIERNGDPLVDHHKEGDLYQALSTRPQPPLLNDTNMGVNLDALPKPSFRLVTDEKNEESKNRQNEKANDDSGTTTNNIMEDESTVPQQRFQRPENHYIRYIEPSEADLMDMIEYDMDEHDDAWLQMLNEERRKEDLGEVSGDLFEAVMDQLEKEWFDLVKNLPKQVAEEPTLPEDSACAICDDTECENSNAIVFCDGCNLAVHQDCYGIPYIPEGQWLCRKCLVSPENPVSCIFCPNEGGAFKQTNTNKWGHLLCAIWIPEVGLSNSVYMEPIDNIENIPKSRWKLTCYICRRRQGACIQCDSKHCFVAFHVTCARWARLCMRMKSHGSHYDGVVFKAYCDKHTPRDYLEQVNVEQTVAAAQTFFSNSHRRKGNHHHQLQQQQMARQRYVDGSSEISTLTNCSIESSIERQQEEEEDNRKKKHKKKRRTNSNNNNNNSGHDNSAVTQMLPSSKAARAHQHHYSAGAPIAPEYIINKLENMKCVRQATNLRKRSQLIVSICRYWSLKRESRRGAPLLKRLHLEPWTASSSQHKQTEVEKAHRAAAMMNLRADLERVRMLSEQVQKREKQKLERIRKQKAYLEMILFPIEYIAKPLVDQLIEMDKKELFRFPVTPDVAPDYAEIIDTPMSFADILEKFSLHEYTSLEQVENDIMLIWKNCMAYNKPETLYYRTAERLKKVSIDLITQAKQDYNELLIRKETGVLSIDIHPEIFTYNTVHVPSPEELAAERERLEQEEKTRLEEEEKSRLEQEEQERLLAKKLEAKKKLQLEREKAKEKHEEAKRKKRASDAIRRERLRAEKLKAKLLQEQKQQEEEQVVMGSNTSSLVSSSSGDATVPSNGPNNNSNNRITTRSSRAKAIQKEKETIKEEEKGEEKEKQESKKSLRRRTRSMGSEGLVAPTAEQVQRRTSSEARNLLWHSDSVAAEQKNVSPLKLDLKRKAPPGWLYVEDNSSNNNSDADSPTPSPRKKPRRERPSKIIKLEPITDIKPKMIVWARVKGFPPHPAKIVDTKEDDIGKHVLSSKHGEQDVLVEFYEVPDHHKWGWVSRTDIFALGDPEHDTEMLLVARKKRNYRRIKESRVGYEFACKILGLDPLPALNNSTFSKK